MSEKYISKNNLKKEYYDRFVVDHANTIENFHLKSTYDKALTIALDIRKFEIDLYWRRANYFWLFVTAMFTAFFLVSQNVFKVVIDKEKFIISNSMFLILISFLGFIFSLGWFYVNRASKYWQNNWERHVDLLGREIHGELFTTIKASNRHFWELSKEYPFSVSKVNQLLSLIVVFVWVILYVFSLIIFLDNYSGYEICRITLGVLLGLLLMGIVAFIFTYQSRSFIKDFTNLDADIEFYLKD